jgi:hypothetical protein
MIGMGLLIPHAKGQGAPQSVEIAKVDLQTVAAGYRASKVIGSSVVNDGNETIGKIDDLLVTRDGKEPYILLPFDIGLNVSRRHQSYGMTECLQLARPMMRRGASLDANQTWRQLLEERQHVATLQLAADYYLANRINSVDLEH